MKTIEINVVMNNLKIRLMRQCNISLNTHYDGVKKEHVGKYQPAADKDRMTGELAGCKRGQFCYVNGRRSKFFLQYLNSIISTINMFAFSNKGNLNLFDVRYQLRLNDFMTFHLQV